MQVPNAGLPDSPLAEKARKAREWKEWRRSMDERAGTRAYSVGEIQAKENQRATDLGAWRPETEHADIVQRVEDSRRITLGRLLSVDLPKAVKRYGAGYSREQRATLVQDAAIEMSKAPLPLRRDWIEQRVDSSKRTRVFLTPQAWRAMSGAIDAAERTSTVRREQRAEQLEQASAPDTIISLAEQARAEHEADAPSFVISPDIDPARLAPYLDCTLDSARVVVRASAGFTVIEETGARGATKRRAEPVMSIDDCAREWGLSIRSVSDALYRGAKALAARYPNPADLLIALDRAAGALAAATEDSARETLRDYAAGYVSEQEANRAAQEWRATTGLSESRSALETRALVLACSRAMRRAGIAEQGSEARDKARCIVRLLGAEQDRAIRETERGTHYSAPPRDPYWHVAGNVASVAPIVRAPSSESPSARSCREWNALAPEQRERLAIERMEPEHRAESLQAREQHADARRAWTRKIGASRKRRAR